MLDNNWKFVIEFEKLLAKYTGFKYAITTDCCTNSLLLSLELLNSLMKISKDNILSITKYTYLSVPMMLKNNNWKFLFVDNKWHGKYLLGNTNIFDAATDFKENMCLDYANNALVCVSFQLKKRFALGRGGVILTNIKKYATLLRRMRYDGRNPMLSDKYEITYTNDIILGYHCYMEPDKAAKGILLLNQKQLLPKYVEHSYNEYNDVSKLNIW